MQIHNGDHAQFEIDNAGKAPQERSDWPLPSFDAQDWAKAFVKLHGGDEGLMLTWFANALMRGYDQPRDTFVLDLNAVMNEIPEPFYLIELRNLTPRSWICRIGSKVDDRFSVEEEAGSAGEVFAAAIATAKPTT